MEGDTLMEMVFNTLIYVALFVGIKFWATIYMMLWHGGID